jgi:hypothetical protein
MRPQETRKIRGDRFRRFTTVSMPSSVPGNSYAEPLAGPDSMVVGIT